MRTDDISWCLAESRRTSAFGLAPACRRVAGCRPRAVAPLRKRVAVVGAADAGNNRIQVFDSEGTFKSQIANIGTPQAICISGGSTQYLYSSNSNDSESLERGEIYKLQLNGQVVGKFGKAGKLPKEFGIVNAIDCRTETDLWVGEIWNWRAQKVTLRK